MEWLRFIYNAGWVLQICANVVLLYSIYPAYKRTKHRAFLFLGYAYLISIFNTICDQTIGHNRMAGAGYFAYHTERGLAYIADTVLFTIGILLLVHPYLKSDVPAAPEASDIPKPPGFFARVFRKLGE
jgi:hypothetical protein